MADEPARPGPLDQPKHELPGAPSGMFTKATVFSAESARVGLVSCLRCGAAILIDPRDNFDMQQLHISFHERLAAAERAGDSRHRSPHTR